MRRDACHNLSLLCLLLLLLTGPASAKAGSLKGQLYRDEHPVAGAQVYLVTLQYVPYRGPVNTNPAGFFVFEAVDAGSYCLVAIKGQVTVGARIINTSEFASGFPRVVLDGEAACGKDVGIQSTSANLSSTGSGKTAAAVGGLPRASFETATNQKQQPRNAPRSGDIALVDLFCAICGIVVLYPIVRYLMRHWAFRRDRLFGFLERGAIVYYYKQFRPGEDPAKAAKTGAPAVSAEEYMRAFKRDFHRWYGRKYYTAPLVMLAVLTGVSGWWASRNLQVWAVDSSSLQSLRALVGAALAGAFVWVISDELDRLRRRDFTVSDVYYYVFRLLLSIPFGWALTRATVTLQVGIPVAFFLGAFPTTTLFTIARRVASQQLKLGDDVATGKLELENLQSIGKPNAERFKDEGVTTITGLAYADPIDLTIRTNFDFNYVVDCVSQALMWIYFGADCTKLFSLSLRGAQEISTVVAWLDDPAHQASAQQTVTEAAAILNITPGALRTTFDQIRGDPYTQFLVNVWG